MRKFPLYRGNIEFFREKKEILMQLIKTTFANSILCQDCIGINIICISDAKLYKKETLHLSILRRDGANVCLTTPSINLVRNKLLATLW